MSKPLKLEELPLALGRRLRRKLLPLLGNRSKGGAEDRTTGGDIVFGLDRIAEDELKKFMSRVELPVAYFSEDKGLVSGSALPEFILVVDPVDGTRPAIAGLESACVSVALAPYYPDVTIGDVIVGVIIEIKEGKAFMARKGKGLDVYDVRDKPLSYSLSTNTDIKSLFWAFELAGRPAEGVVKTLKKLINQSSLAGGCFVISSATYALTRILTGQLDAYIDPWERVYKESDYFRAKSRDFFDGRLLGLKCYDLAAAVIICREAGVTITDAFGKNLEPMPLLDTSEKNTKSCVAAASAKLHKKIIELLDKTCPSSREAD